MEKIEKFIAGLRTAGRGDGQGEFTLDLGLARRKLAEYQLPRPEYWVLKIIQAAVAFRAQDVRIDIDKMETKIAFEPDEELDAERIYESLGLTSPQDPGLYHLTTGILCGLFDSSDEFCWSTNTTQKQKTVRLHAQESDQIEHFEGSSLSETCSFEITAARPRRKTPFLWKLFATRSELLSHSLEETWAIKRLARFSPVPVILNGKSIYRGPRHDQGYESCRHHFLYAGLSRPEDGINKLSPLPEQKGYTRELGELKIQESTRYEEPFASRQLTPPLSSFLTLSQDQQETKSSVMFVCDGVLVDRYPLDIEDQNESGSCQASYAKPLRYKLLLQLVISIECKELDLGHFAIRDPKHLLERTADPYFQDFIDLLTPMAQEVSKARHDLNPWARDLLQKIGLVKPRKHPPTSSINWPNFNQAKQAQKALLNWIPTIKSRPFSERLEAKESFNFPDPF